MNGQNYIDKVYQHLLINETITPEEAMRLYGITRLSSCISELRKKGYEIITETFFIMTAKNLSGGCTMS